MLIKFNNISDLKYFYNNEWLGMYHYKLIDRHTIYLHDMFRHIIDYDFADRKSVV
jgi:hypothetical protein